MQIVIEIPEEWFCRLQNEWGWALAENVREAIKRGTPLPKGHGRLIDADAYKKQNDDILDCEIDHPKYQDTLRELIDNAPTIIEADTVIEADKKKRDCKNCKNCARIKSYDYNGYYKQYFPRYYDYCKVGGGDEGAFSEYCNKFQRKEAEEAEHE